MRYRVLGRTGVDVSEIGFGGAGAGLPNYLRRWDASNEDQFDQAVEAIEHAVEVGINYFDTAPAYGSEALFGRALKPHRDRVFIATKVRALTAGEIVASVDESLRLLETDHLDLIQYHGDWYTDSEIEQFFAPEGVLAAFRTLKRGGRVRFVGFCAEGHDTGTYRLIKTGEFDVIQIQYNVMFQHPYDASKRSGAMYDAEAQGMGIVIMRPLTGGMFEKWIETVVPGIAQQTDLGKALLSFVLSNPLTDVALVGMRSAGRVDQNCAVSDDSSTRLDLDGLFGRFLRKPPGSDEEVWLPTSGRFD